ncbi:hypothetical protein MPER_04258, partial [Moniliophthora perniciosa FA553]
DRSVARKLLFIEGIVSRVVYEKEMREIKRRWEENNPPSMDLQNELRSKAIHVMKFFTFHPSTPSSDIASLIEAAFFACTTIVSKFSLISSTGICDVADIRLPDPSFSFLKELPVLPHEVLDGARLMVTSLQIRGLIKPIQPEDVWKELRARPLTEEELTSCLKWWTSLDQSVIGPAQLAALLDAALFITGEPGSPSGNPIPLNAIKTFFNRSRGLGIPMDGPLPHYMLPESVSRNLVPARLSSHLRLRGLTMFEWVDYLCSGKSFPKYEFRLLSPMVGDLPQP